MNKIDGCISHSCVGGDCQEKSSTTYSCNCYTGFKGTYCDQGTQTSSYLIQKKKI